MSEIKEAYITGSNNINSIITVSVISSDNNHVTASYQWYRSLEYEGLFESIPFATNQSYKINVNDRYLKCEVTGTGEFTNTVFTNILVVNQLELANISKNRNNTRLSNIGKGLSLEQLVSQVSGTSNIVYDIARINQSIKIILSTAKGEVPMIPELGTNLHKKLFEGMVDEFLDEVVFEVRSCLEEQEPRIDILSIDANYEDDNHIVYVIINYAVKNTNIQSQYIYNVDVGGENSG